MDEIRVGLIGYGTAGAVFHAPLIAATPGLRLAAVVTRDPARQDEVSARYGATPVAGVAALWELCDLVVVASPNRTHASLAGEALERGRAVVVDKPFARTAEEARAVTRLAREKGALLTVFQNRRWARCGGWSRGSSGGGRRPRAAGARPAVPATPPGCSTTWAAI